MTQEEAKQKLKEYYSALEERVNIVDIETFKEVPLTKKYLIDSTEVDKLVVNALSVGDRIGLKKKGIVFDEDTELNTLYLSDPQKVLDILSFAVSTGVDKLCLGSAGSKELEKLKDPDVQKLITAFFLVTSSLESKIGS
ncbi:hypothetical protein [Cognatishimia sp.]|uniref:hypothetical protein n=1 Tax=Cognatishimia sp. TaxID=2211648 RepID=UPI003513AB37|nr:hypothetical protein [Cognatishimia sp.]